MVREDINCSHDGSQSQSAKNVLNQSMPLLFSPLQFTLTSSHVPAFFAPPKSLKHTNNSFLTSHKWC